MKNKMSKLYEEDLLIRKPDCSDESEPPNP